MGQIKESMILFIVIALYKSFYEMFSWLTMKKFFQKLTMLHEYSTHRIEKSLANCFFRLFQSILWTVTAKTKVSWEGTLCGVVLKLKCWTHWRIVSHLATRVHFRLQFDYRCSLILGRKRVMSSAHVAYIVNSAVNDHPAVSVCSIASTVHTTYSCTCWKCWCT